MSERLMASRRGVWFVAGRSTGRSSRRTNAHWTLRSILVVASMTIASLWSLSGSASATASTATVTIMHGLPGFTADVYVNGKLTLDGFKPQSSTPALQLPAGTYKIAIRNVGQSATTKAVLSASITLEAGVDYTVVAHLDGSGEPTVSLFRNDRAGVPVARARLVVRNVANAPQLSLSVDGRNRFSGLTYMSDASAIIAPGRHAVGVGSSDGSVNVLPANLSVNEGSELVIYIIGSADDGSIDLMAQRISGLGTQPSSIPTGNGGLAAASSTPAWAVMFMIAGGLIASRAWWSLVHARRRSA